jgi:putative DNA primase/helicase
VHAVVDSTPNGEEFHRALNLKADIRRLEQAIADIGNVVLVVIDPLSAYLGNGDSHNNSQMRGLLAPLSDMAARLNVAVVLISHLNKGGGGEALMRVTGSLAFVAAARAAFIVAKDPEDEERRLFLPAKNNVAKDVGGLAFHIETIITKGNETSRVMWEAKPVNDVTADEILRQPVDPEEKGARAEAKAFLLDLLAHGPIGPKDVFANARNAAVSEKTLQRASRDIGVKKSKTGMKGGWVWELPPKTPNHTEDGLPKTEGTFAESGHLREPRCPRCAGGGLPVVPARGVIVL